MSAVIDFSALVRELHETSETLVDQEARANISPYLLDTLLPLLEQGTFPKLRDIDFAQFEEDDPLYLAGYVQERSHCVYQMLELNRNLCKFTPVCTNTRAFL